MNQPLAQAVTLAIRLNEAIREAHREACHAGSDCAEMLLFNLIEPGVSLEQRIARVQEAVETDTNLRLAAGRTAKARTPRKGRAR